MAVPQVAPASVEVRYSYPERPEAPPDEPDAVIVVDAWLSHDSDPPATVGALGLVRSRRTVLVAPEVVGVQEDVLPALSIERYWTSVSPSALITTEAPEVAVPQLTPASVEVRYS